MSDFVLPQSSEIITPNSSIPQIQQFSELSVGGGPNKFLVTKNGLSIGNTVIVDSEGLNSLNNFPSDTIFDDTNRSPASTTYEDIPGGTLTSFTLVRQTRVLTYLRADVYHVDYNENGLNYQVQVRMIDTFDNAVTDGIEHGGNYVVDDINFAGTSWSSYVSAGTDVTSISNDLYEAGTHQFKAQYKVDGGTGNLWSYQIGYIVLGI
jgi:hypothetical protein